MGQNPTLRAAHAKEGRQPVLWGHLPGMGLGREESDKGQGTRNLPLQCSMSCSAKIICRYWASICSFVQEPWHASVREVTKSWTRFGVWTATTVQFCSRNYSLAKKVHWNLSPAMLPCITCFQFLEQCFSDRIFSGDGDISYCSIEQPGATCDYWAISKWVVLKANGFLLVWNFN